MEQRLTIIGLGVSNLSALTMFYQEKFGWQKMPSSNEGITFFQLNGILLSVSTRQTSRGCDNKSRWYWLQRFYNGL